MIQGVYHQPYGYDSLYGTEPTERAPRDPMAGDTVTVNAATWPVEDKQAVWVTWTRNGVAQPDVQAAFRLSKDGTSYWRADLGAFARGDQVTYTVHANESGADEQTSGPFTFSVASWSHVTRVTAVKDNGTSVDLHVGDSAHDYSPVVRVTFPVSDTVRVQLSPTGQGLTATDSVGYRLADDGTHVSLTTDDLVVRVAKNPYGMSVLQRDGTTVVVEDYDPETFHNLGWASDGARLVSRLETHLAVSPDERFHGFGERYDQLDQFGQKVSTYIYNEYGDQAATDRTYLSVPFYVSSAGYGFHLSSTAYSRFELGTSRPDMVGMVANSDGTAHPLLDYYVFTGSPKRILDRFSALTGRPVLPPKWAFGLWISANEWNSQSMVKAELDAAAANEIPVNVLVLEQWADEATFCVWHGAQYTPKPGREPFSYADFTFPPDGEWPDPKAMVADAHARGVRVVLWQIPAFKELFHSPNPHYPTEAPPQLLNDKDYAVQQGFVVGDGTGNPARLPLHSWFGNSMVPDFTNPDAVAWWMSKRAYLVDEVGVDGFKCDGGEAVFSRSNVFHDGRPGAVMHNAYPSTYIGAYSDLMRQKRGTDAVVLSRAGTTGAQSLSTYWAGDQLSSFDAFQAAIRAGLSAGTSGVPMWTWDMAGFAGQFPSAELYLRSAAMSAFAPVMQLHSQWSAPGSSATRTPWHVQQVTGDDRVVPMFRRFANVRMNLVPYVYSESKHASDHGAPVLRAMHVDFPDDPATGTLDQQYLFGGQMLVGPVTVEGATSKDVYVPDGEWWDIWYNAPFTGPRTKLYDVPLDAIPVYAKPGAVIPLNLDDTYQLGGAVGNDVSHNVNLTFRIYPSGATQYDYYDDTRGSVATVKVQESWRSHQVSVQVPGVSEAVTLQVVSGSPQVVTVDGAEVPARAGLAAASSGWFWDPGEQTTLVRLPQSDQARLVTLNGVDKACYGAEFAVGIGTTTSTNHAGFGGTGFVDGFDSPGDSVTFSVRADVAGTTTLRFRYANAGGSAAGRGVWVDGVRVGTLALPPLADWDTWGDAGIDVPLVRGPHQVQLAYDDQSAASINLDSLSLVHVVTDPASVVTQHNNNARTGANLHEHVLTTTTVTPRTFGKLYAYPVQGQVFAQPLYVPDVPVQGRGQHNVVLVATMNNRVYAFDADDPLQASLPLWDRHLAPSILLPDANIGPTYIDENKHDTGKARRPDGTIVYEDIVTEVGILSTPVVSRDRGTVYVVTASKDPGGSGTDAYRHQLHALDLATGADRPGSPVQITATAPGQGYTGEQGESDDVRDGQIHFVSHRQLQRAGLLLLDKQVVVAFASYGDKDCYHGWVLAYDPDTLQQTAVLTTTPTKLDVTDPDYVGRGGIWQAGAGLAADSTGIYFSTGNGGYADGTDFGDCFLRLYPQTLQVKDWFTPFNQLQLANNDIDLGSSGVLLVPGTNLLIGGGKESKFFVIKRDSMGRYLPDKGNSQIVQHFYVHAPTNPDDPIRSARKYDGTGHHIHGAPAYWHGAHGPWVYVWAEEDVVKAYQLSAAGTVDATPITLKGIPDAHLGVTASQGAARGAAGVSGTAPGMPGGMLSISADGNTSGTGILWATHPLENANRGIVPGIVRAYDAGDLRRELWNSRANAARDDLGTYAKFSAPTVANGRVYVGTFSGQVAVYGLL